MKNVSKVIFVCLAILFLSLSFFGCNGEVENGLNASINEVFYTKLDPQEKPYEELVHETTLLTGESYKYYLVVDFYQPNKDVVKLVAEYSTGEDPNEFYITPRYVDQISWVKINWSEVDENTTETIRFYLEDAEGNRSAPYTMSVDLW